MAVPKFERRNTEGHSACSEKGSIPPSVAARKPLCLLSRSGDSTEGGDRHECSRATAKRISSPCRITTKYAKKKNLRFRTHLPRVSDFSSTQRLQRTQARRKYGRKGHFQFLQALARNQSQETFLSLPFHQKSVM